MRLALLNIQQRNYVQTLAYLNKEKKVMSSMGRRPDVKEEEGIKMEEEEEKWVLPKIAEIVDESLMCNIAQECYRNLNEWEEVANGDKSDILGNTEFLFHAEGNKDKINSILGGLDKIGVKQFPYYYGRSVLNFL